MQHYGGVLVRMRRSGFFGRVSRFRGGSGSTQYRQERSRSLVASLLRMTTRGKGNSNGEKRRQQQRREATATATAKATAIARGNGKGNSNSQREQQRLERRQRPEAVSGLRAQNSRRDSKAIMRGELSPPRPTPSRPVGGDVVEVRAPKPVCVAGFPGIPAKTMLGSAKLG